MDKSKIQQMRISDVELDLLKGTFADKDEVMKIIRNLFLGLETSNDEKELVRSLFKGEALRKMMRKQFLPELQPDIPVGQNIDLWMTIDIKDKDGYSQRQMIEARGELIDMMDKALNLLVDPYLSLVDLSAWSRKPWGEGKAGSLLARNTYISHIEAQMGVIKVLSGLKSETVEETKERLMKNSTK